MHKVLIIGAGGIGRRHIKGYLSTKRASLSIVEPNVEKRQEVENEFSIGKSYSNFSEVNLNDYDFVLICAPANYHIAPMKICAENKIPFMVEKPLSINLDGVSEVIELVKKNKLFARVGYTRRNSLIQREVRSQILDGKIGDLKLVYINSSQEFPKYRPDFQSTYYAKPEMGGGAILDASSHMIDQLIWIIGKPTEVSCMYDRMVLEGTNTEDTCLINIRFENGSMANISVNQFQKPNVNSYEFIGTKGNLLLDHSILKFSNDDSGLPKETTDFMKGLDPMEIHQNNFSLQANSMLDGLEGKSCGAATLQEAKLNLQVALAAKQSWDEKRIISIVG
jgi:predicted dehydrogenase